jgi:hypothetical protein
VGETRRLNRWQGMNWHRLATVDGRCGSDKLADELQGGDEAGERLPTLRSHGEKERT